MKTMNGRMLGPVLVSLIIMAALAGCETSEPAVTATPTEDTEPSAAATDTAMPSIAPVGWTADGVVTEGEYDHSAQISGVSLWWSSDAGFLYLAMEAETTGWVAVGLDPESRMQGANFIVGAVDEGEAMVWDAYGAAPVGADHPPDSDLGWTDDIVAFAGIEEQGVTRLEVQIPLDSGDEYDKPLLAGETYPVIVAIGSSDAFDASHVSRGAGQIELD